MKFDLRLLLLLVPSVAWATDLLEAYGDALTYDAQFVAAKASLAAGLEKLPQGRAGLLPVLGLSANSTKNDTNYKSQPSTGVIVTKYNSSGWGVSLTQPLFRWQNWETYRQSELAAALAETQYAQAQQELMLRVVQSYFDVILGQEFLLAATAQKAALAEQLAATRRGAELGTASPTDTQETLARYDLALAQEAMAANDLTIKRRALKLLTGKEANQLKKLKPALSIARPLPDNDSEWAASAERGSLATLIAQANFEIAAREVAKQRAGHLPTVDLVANRGRTTQDSTLVASFVYPGNETTSSTLGVQLSLPLFAGGSTASRDREAVALRDKAQADIDHAKRQAGLQAVQAYFGVTSGLAQIRALEQGLDAAKTLLEAAKFGYKIGMRPNLDVLNAEQQLYSNWRDLAKARLETLVAQVRLRAAVGLLNSDDLGQVNALLE